MSYYYSAIVHNLVPMLSHVIISPANTLLCCSVLCYAVYLHSTFATAC